MPRRTFLGRARDAFSRSPSVKHSALVPFSNTKYLSEFPVNRSYYKAMKSYVANEILYGCIKLRTDTTGEIKFTVMENGADVEQGEIIDRLAKPDGEMSLSDWLVLFQLYYDLTGNVYVLREKNSLDQVIGWYLLRPDRMNLYPDPSQQRDFYWQYIVDGDTYYYSLEDVHHFKSYDPTNDWFGVGPVEACERMLEIDNLQTKLVYSFMGNAGIPAAFLKVKEEFKNDAQYEQFRSQMASSISGAQAGKFGMLIGDTELVMAGQFTAPEQEEVRRQTESRICAVMRVDPRLIGANVGIQATSGNVDFIQARKAFAENAMMPIWDRIADFFNKMVYADFPDSEYKIQLDTSDVRYLQESEAEKIKKAGDLFQRGLARRNESRKLAGLPPDDSELGEEYYSGGQQPMTAGLNPFNGMQSRWDYLYGYEDDENFNPS